MNRFDDDDNTDNAYSDFEGDDNHEEIENTQEYQAFLRQQEIDTQQIQLVNRELNQKLLKQAIATCEKSFWWRFMSVRTKLSRIEDAYVLLLGMVMPYEEEEE